MTKLRNVKVSQEGSSVRDPFFIYKSYKFCISEWQEMFGNKKNDPRQKRWFFFSSLPSSFVYLIHTIDCLNVINILKSQMQFLTENNFSSFNFVSLAGQKYIVRKVRKKYLGCLIRFLVEISELLEIPNGVRSETRCQPKMMFN